MTFRKSSVVVLTVSLLAFPYAVLAVGNVQKDEGKKESTTAERAEKTDSAGTSARLEDADADAMTDNDLRAAIKVLAAQVRQLNERVSRLENPTQDARFEELGAIDKELQRALREVQTLEQDVSAMQAQLDAKRMEATALQDELVDALKQMGVKRSALPDFAIEDLAVLDPEYATLKAEWIQLRTLERHNSEPNRQRRIEVLEHQMSQRRDQLLPLIHGKGRE